MAPRKIKYYRNTRPNPIRVSTVSLNPRGQEGDSAEVTADVYDDKRFTNSVGVLVEEITKAEYDSLMDAEKANRAQEVNNPTLTIYHSDAEGKTSDLNTTQAQVVDVEKAKENKEREVVLEVSSDGVAQYQGAEAVTKGRKDPAREGVQPRGR